MTGPSMYGGPPGYPERSARFRSVSPATGHGRRRTRASQRSGSSPDFPCDTMLDDSSSTRHMSQPVNEPIMGYAPGSPERAALQNEIDRQLAEVIEIPCVINGEMIFTGNTVTQVVPHDHGHVLANVHLAGRDEMEAACEAAVNGEPVEKLVRGLTPTRTAGPHAM